VAQLTRRLESDLQLTSPAAAAAAAAGGFAPSSQLRASLGSLGAAPLSAASGGRGSAATAAAASVSKQTLASRLGSQSMPPAPHASQQPAASSGFSGLPSGGTFATPASSLLQRSASLETPHPQQAVPHSAASTAAGPAGLALRRDSFASLDGTPDRQAVLGQALRQLQAATEKGANRLQRLEGIVRAIGQGGSVDASSVSEASRAVAALRQSLQEMQQGQAALELQLKYSSGGSQLAALAPQVEEQQRALARWEARLGRQLEAIVGLQKGALSARSSSSLGGKSAMQALSSGSLGENTPGGPMQTPAGGGLPFRPAAGM
jgi:hypothetical protein